MGQFGVIAIDGTKIAANASRTELEAVGVAEAGRAAGREALSSAADVDAAEDARHGGGTGMDLHPLWADQDTGSALIADTLTDLADTDTDTDTDGGSGADTGCVAALVAMAPPLRTRRRRVKPPPRIAQGCRRPGFPGPTWSPGRAALWTSRRLGYRRPGFPGPTWSPGRAALWTSRRLGYRRPRFPGPTWSPGRAALWTFRRPARGCGVRHRCPGGSGPAGTGTPGCWRRWPACRGSWTPGTPQPGNRRSATRRPG